MESEHVETVKKRILSLESVLAQSSSFNVFEETIIQIYRSHVTEVTNEGSEVLERMEGILQLNIKDPFKEKGGSDFFVKRSFNNVEKIFDAIFDVAILFCMARPRFPYNGVDDFKINNYLTFMPLKYDFLKKYFHNTSS